jgi:hypothetical protein
MGCLLQSIWVVLGYTQTNSQQRSQCCCVEDGAFMPLVVSMKGNE